MEENIAHYSGNFLEIAAVGYGVASAIVGAGIGISGGFLIVGSAVITIGIVEGLKALGFELGDYTEIAYKIAKEKIASMDDIAQEYANEIMNDEEVKLFSPAKDYKQKLYTDFAGALKYFNEDGSVNFAKYLADTANISLYDPIALDFDGNGKIDTLSLENGVFFDHNGDKIAFKSSWVNSSDGILARDIDGDGAITSGAELFGNKSKSNNHYSYTNPNAKDGFEALKEPDSNNDGIISNLDENFDKLQIWQDSNSNGVSETNELKSLSELGIESLNLNKFTNLNLLVA